MSNYYAVPALSNTAMGWLKKSPFHCQSFLTGKIQKDTKSMKIGRLLHAGILTPDLQTFVGCNQTSNKGKEQAEEYKKQGFTVVTEAEYKVITNCIEVLRDDPEIAELLRGAECEKPVYWEMDGVQCKGLVDIYNPNFRGKKIMADPKFLQDAHPKEVLRKATYTYDYDRQMAWYCEGLRRLGIELDEIWLIACEKEPPYAYSISKFKVSSEFMENGKTKWQELFATYLETVHIGVTPSYETTTYEGKEAEEVDEPNVAVSPDVMDFFNDDLFGETKKLTSQALQPNSTTKMIVPEKSLVASEYPKKIKSKGNLARIGEIIQTDKNKFAVKFYSLFHIGNHCNEVYYADSKKAANTLLLKHL